MIFFGQPFEARGEVDGVADDGEFHLLGGAEVADDDFAVVQADADVEFGHAASAPVGVQLLQTFPHGERGGDGVAGVQRGAGADDVAPDGHDGVADKLVERAVMREDEPHHLLEIFVELLDELGGVRVLSERGEAAHVGEQNGDRLADAGEGVEERLRVVEQFLDDVFGDVALQSFSHARLIEPLEQEVEGQHHRAADEEHEQRRGDGQEKPGVVEKVFRQKPPARAQREDGEEALDRLAEEEAQRRREKSGERDDEE